MRALCVNILLVSLLFAQAQQKEIKEELLRLQKLRAQIEAKLEEHRKILQAIKQERQKLEKLKQEIERSKKEIEKARYKKLAKDFASMEPEAAGEKLSKLDPKIAAYILFNMNPRKAGEALNYMDPTMVSKITKILTQIKKHENQSH